MNFLTVLFQLSDWSPTDRIKFYSLETLVEICLSQDLLNYSTYICFRKLIWATTVDWVSEWILNWNLMKLPDLSVMIVICKVGNSTPRLLESKKCPRWRRQKVLGELDQDKLFLRPHSLAARSPPPRISMKLIGLPTIRCSRAPRISTGTSQEWEEADPRWEDPSTEVYLLSLAPGRLISNSY